MKSKTPKSGENAKLKVVENALKFSFFSPSIRFSAEQNRTELSRKRSERWLNDEQEFFQRLSENAMELRKLCKFLCFLSIFQPLFAKMLISRERTCGTGMVNNVQTISMLLSSNHPLWELTTREIIYKRVLLLMRGFSIETETRVNKN